MLKSIVKNSEKLFSYSHCFAHLYHHAYKAVIDRELSMLSLKDGAKVLFIGSGAFPFTPLWLATLQGCHVTAIDIDHYAVKRARRVVKKHALDAFIDIHTTSLDNGNASFDAAILALQVSPLNETIETLYSQGIKTIIVRRPSPRFTEQYDALDARYNIQDYVVHGMRAFHDSVLLQF